MNQKTLEGLPLTVEQQADELYQAYPRHVAKGAAIKAILKALQTTSFETLLSAVREYASARRLPGQDQNLTPHPATWFNACRWEDDRSQWRLIDPSKERGARASDFQQSKSIPDLWLNCLMVLSHGLNQRMPPEQIQVYYAILRDLPIESVQASIHRHLSTTTSAFLPPPGLIRQMAVEWSQGKVVDSSEAWGLARKAVADFGYLRGREACEWLPPPVAEAVRRIGFQTLCDMEPEAHTATRARFIECYQQVMTKVTLERACPPAALPGAGLRKYLETDFLKDATDAVENAGQVRLGQHGEGPCQDWGPARPQPDHS